VLLYCQASSYVPSCIVNCICYLQVEYKFVVLAADGVNAAAWQSGNNSVLAVQAGEEALEVFDNW
jgi:hypothetical protein